MLDEFHERSLHVDLGLALTRRRGCARRDLRIMVMSATIDAVAGARYLDGCPVVSRAGSRTSAGRRCHAPGDGREHGRARRCSRTTGDVLCFLPGAGEIERALAECRGLRRAPRPRPGAAARRRSARTRRIVRCVPGLRGRRRGDPGHQHRRDVAHRARRIGGRRRGPGQKVARYDAERAIDTLVLERVTADSATQRAGPCGATRPRARVAAVGRADRLRPRASPRSTAWTWPAQSWTSSPGAPILTRSSGSRPRRRTRSMPP